MRKKKTKQEIEAKLLVKQAKARAFYAANRERILVNSKIYAENRATPAERAQNLKEVLIEARKTITADVIIKHYKAVCNVNKKEEIPGYEPED